MSRNSGIELEPAKAGSKDTKSTSEQLAVKQRKNVTKPQECVNFIAETLQPTLPAPALVGMGIEWYDYTPI
jgi:hypothetical protein